MPSIVWILLLLFVVMVVFLVVLVLCLYRNPEKYTIVRSMYPPLSRKQQQDAGTCMSYDQCQQSCQKGTLLLSTNVIYCYWLYPVEQEPSLADWDASDIKQRFKDAIDSGYNIVNLSFYEYQPPSPDRVGAYGKFMWLSPEERTEIVEYAHARKVRLLVSAGGAAGTSSFREGTYKDIADDLYNVIESNHLDGLDIDIEATDLFDKIIDITNYLGEKWKGKDRWITHAPQSANFGNNTGSPSDYFTVYQKCGQYIDYLNIQFYNQGCNHETCETLFGECVYNCWNMAWISTGKAFPTSIQSEPVPCTKPYGSVIPLDKIIIGKPICGQQCQYGGSNGYMEPDLLARCINSAYGDYHWRTGLMIWAYVPSDVVFPLPDGSQYNAAQYLSVLNSKLTIPDEDVFG